MTLHQLEIAQRLLIWISAAAYLLIAWLAIRRPVLFQQCYIFVAFCFFTGLYFPLWNPANIERCIVADCILLPLKVCVAVEIFCHAVNFLPAIERRQLFVLLLSFIVPALVVCLGYFSAPRFPLAMGAAVGFEPQLQIVITYRTVRQVTQI